MFIYNALVQYSILFDCERRSSIQFTVHNTWGRALYNRNKNSVDKNIYVSKVIYLITLS